MNLFIMVTLIIVAIMITVVVTVLLIGVIVIIEGRNEVLEKTYAKIKEVYYR